MPDRLFHDRLLAMTRGCRHDMHEPDEQGLSARVTGDHLDNAMGDGPPERAHGEFIVELTRDTDAGIQVEYFNLASLLALARLADRSLLPAA